MEREGEVVRMERTRESVVVKAKQRKSTLFSLHT
jgi:hypothetical protein